MSLASRSGYPEKQFEQMIKFGYRYLERLARAGEDTYYTEFSNVVNEHCGSNLRAWTAIPGLVLDRIGQRSFDQRKVVLSALVHYKGKGPLEIGEGFYDLCKKLGILPKGTRSDIVKRKFLLQRLSDIALEYH